MEYGDLIRVGKNTYGYFITTRPNGNAIYDRFFIVDKYESLNGSGSYSAKWGTVTKIILTLSETTDLITPVSTGDIIQDYENKITEVEAMKPCKLLQTDNKIDEYQEKIRFLETEIFNTKKKDVDETTEDVVVRWENKLKAIKEKQKSINHYQNKIDKIKDTNEKQYSRQLTTQENTLTKLRKEKSCLVNFLSKC